MGVQCGLQGRQAFAHMGFTALARTDEVALEHTV
jgi:hypothetical protein